MSDDGVINMDRSPYSGRRGGGDDGGTSERLTRLETHFEYVQRDLGEVKTVLHAVSQKIDSLPTRGDLWSWKLQWAGLCVAAVALIVGGIIGGLAWIQPASAPQPPLVITMPPAPAAQ